MHFHLYLFFCNEQECQKFCFVRGAIIGFGEIPLSDSNINVKYFFSNIDHDKINAEIIYL